MVGTIAGTARDCRTLTGALPPELADSPWRDFISELRSLITDHGSLACRLLNSSFNLFVASAFLFHPSNFSSAEASKFKVTICDLSAFFFPAFEPLIARADEIARSKVARAGSADLRDSWPESNARF